MKWRDIKEIVSEMSDVDLDTDVTVYDAAADEFHGVYNDFVSRASEGDPADGILDEDHPYLVINS